MSLFFVCFLLNFNEAGPRERCDQGRFLPIDKKSSSYRGVYRVPLLVSLSLCVCVTFVVFTDCESCAWPISTNPGSTEAGECGRTRRTSFITRRLEVVAVVGLLWVSWCVFGAAFVFCVLFSTFSPNAHGLL